MSVAAPNLFAGGVPWYGLHRAITYEAKAKVFEIAGYRPHANQERIHKSNARMRIVVCGRRFGKSTAAAYEAIAYAMAGGRVWVVAPSYDLASVVFEEILHAVTHTPLREYLSGPPKLAKGSQAVHFASGGWVAAKSSVKPRSLVGRGLDLVVFDECAKEKNPEVWHGHLRPTLTDRLGAFLAITTPEGDDWVKEQWSRGYTGMAGYETFHLTSYDNPLLDAREIDQARLELPDATFRQEYLAEFLDAEGAVFMGYREVATARLLDAPEQGSRYVIGVDLARYQDWTVLTVMDAHTGEVRHVIRTNQTAWSTQRAIIDATARYWGYADVILDSTGVGDPVLEELGLMADGAYSVQGYVFTATSKTQLINQAVVAIQQRDVALPRDDTDIGRVYLTEMGSFRYERTVAGTLKMGAPPGKHDDCVISFCLALEARMRYTGGPPPMPRRDADSDERPSLYGQYTIDRNPVTAKAKPRPFGRPRFGKPR